MSEQDAGAAVAATDSGAVSAPTFEDTMGAVFDKLERDNGASRDDGGKFASDKPGADTAAAGTETTDTDQTATQPTTGQAKPATEPPTGWSDEDKAWFKTLPPEKQVILAKRESERDADYTRKTQEVANERKKYETLSPVLAPIEAEARKYGLSAHVAVKQMFDRHVDLQTRGPEALKDLAKLYGIKLEGLDGGTDVDSVDPDIAALKSTVATLTHKLTSYEQGQTQATQNALKSEIDSFADEKDSAGKPLRPHFDAVVADMAPITRRLMEEGMPRVKAMAEAYTRACRANPQVWEKLDAERAVEAKAKAEKDAKEAANKARKAADNNTRPSGAHTGGAAKGKSFEDTMGRVYDEQHAA